MTRGKGSKKPLVTSNAEPDGLRGQNATWWIGVVVATLVAGLLGAIVLIAWFPRPTYPSLNVNTPTPYPGVVTVLKSLVAGLVIGVTLARQPAKTRPYQAVLAALMSFPLGTAFSAETATGMNAVVYLVTGATALCVAQWVSRRLLWMCGVVSLVLVLASYLLYTGVVPGPMHDVFGATQQYWAVGTQPPPSYDGNVFLQASANMRQGSGYYPAFVAALKADPRGLPVSSPFNMRPPLVIWLWSVLPVTSTSDLAIYATIVGAVCALLAFLIAAEFVEWGVAAVAAILVCRLYGMSLLFPQPVLALTEFWVAPIALLAVWFTLRRWWVAGAVALCIGILGREMTVLLVPAWIVAVVLRGEMSIVRKWLYVAGGVIAAGLSLVVPYVLASRVIDGSGGGLGHWMNGGVVRLYEAVTLTSGGAGMPVVHPNASVLICIVTLIGVAAIPSRWRLATSATALGLYAMFLIVISGGDASYYWGITFLALVMAFTPVIAARFAPSRQLDSTR